MHIYIYISNAYACVPHMRYTRVYVHICRYISMQMRHVYVVYDIYTYFSIYMYRYIHLCYVCVYVYTYVYTCMYVCMSVCLSVCLYVCMYVCVCARACMHIHVACKQVRIYIYRWRERIARETERKKYDSKRKNGERERESVCVCERVTESERFSYLARQDLRYEANGEAYSINWQSVSKFSQLSRQLLSHAAYCHGALRWISTEEV